MFKFVSDIEDLSVEWDSTMGKYWETFDSLEDMENALNKNEEFNNLPENKAIIDQMDEAQNIWLAKCDLEYYGGLDYCAENNIKIETQRVIKSAKQYGQVAVAVVVKMVIEHNKRVIMTKVGPKPATNLIGDFCDF